MIKFRYTILKKQLVELSDDRICLIDKFESNEIDRLVYSELMSKNLLVDSQTEMKLATCINQYIINIVTCSLLIYFIVLLVKHGIN